MRSSSLIWLSRNSSDTPGAVLYGDITYLSTGEGWLYLPTVIDTCTRMVVGWALDDTMREPFVRRALIQARSRGYVNSDAIFHSDRGSPFTHRRTSPRSAVTLASVNPWAKRVSVGIAAAESFFSSLENEFYPHYRFDTRAAARTAVVKYAAQKDSQKWLLPHKTCPTNTKQHSF